MENNGNEIGRTNEKQNFDALLSDLRLVGPEKPLGYLPVSTLIDLCKVNPDEIIEELKKKGLKTITLNQEDSRIGSMGALYVYDEDALTSLLKNNEAVLKKANWPTDPELFIKHLKNTAEAKTELFNLVADAFGDKINPGRKN